MKSTDAPPPQPSPALQPNRVLAEPATPAACAKDYATGAGDRQAMDRNIRHGR